jgi:lipid II:glycine glycyltransferase (peptidoglycan interpeptide bridge formation enzyme)
MVTIRRIDEKEKEYWNREVQKFEIVHPLNAFGWGAVRSVDKWKPIYLVAENHGLVRGMMMVLVKKIPYTPYSIMYSPKGPVWDYGDRETLAALVGEARRLGDEHNAIFLRIDPNIKEDVISEGNDPFEMLGFIHLEHRWTFWNSPRDVYRIDLTKIEKAEDHFNLMDRDTRRCIRKAAKEGVSIEPATKKSELEKFYKIFSEHSMARGFMIRGYEYQSKLWDEYVEKGNGRLFLAMYKGEMIGGLISIQFARKHLAMHMGTPYRYQKLQSNYAYLWESIRWAKETGCLWFSFRGVGTTPSQEYFKSKFLPEVVRLVGYYDLPLKPTLYGMFNFSEFTVLPKAWPYLISMRDKLHKTKVSNEATEKPA